MVPLPRKGDSLELAVRTIETAILSSRPQLAQASFKIESKKLVWINGVKHEIDIHVAVDLGRGYDSIYIYECKNWQGKVGRNEIIVFSQKIADVRAARGFFVAKSFTRYADIQARRDARMELIIVEESDATGALAPLNFHVVEMINVTSDITLTPYYSLQADQWQNSPIREATARLGEDEMDPEQYVNDWAISLAEERINGFPSGEKPEGRYELTANDKRYYSPEVLIVNGTVVKALSISVSISFRIVRPPVMSYFDVATRGVPLCSHRSN